MPCEDNLALLDQRPSDWAWTVKADGFRAQLHTHPAALWSRAGNSLVSIFPDAVDAAMAALPDVDAVLDCELVDVDKTARPDFAAPSASAGYRSGRGAAGQRRGPGTPRRAGPVGPPNDGS